MNTIARIAAGIANRIVNINNIHNDTNDNKTNTNVKGDKTMYAKINTRHNAAARIATRGIASVFAMGSLLMLSHTTAKADIELYRFIPPAQAEYAPTGQTYMELKVQNTFNYTVSGLQFTIPLSTAAQAQLGGAGDWSNVKSEVFSLAPQEVRWIYVKVPSYGALGTPFYGKQLTGAVYLNEQLLQSVSFVDVLPTADVQATGKLVGQVVLNAGGQVANQYYITFTNNGFAPSNTQTATVSMQRYADGNDGPPYTVTIHVPALAVGKSITYVVTSQDTHGESIRGTVSINNEVVGTF